MRHAGSQSVVQGDDATARGEDARHVSAPPDLTIASSAGRRARSTRRPGPTLRDANAWRSQVTYVFADPGCWRRPARRPGIPVPSAHRAQDAARTQRDPATGRPGHVDIDDHLARVGVAVRPAPMVVLLGQQPVDGMRQPGVSPGAGLGERFEHLEDIADVARREAEPEPRAVRLGVAVAHRVVGDGRVAGEEEVDGGLDGPVDGRASADPTGSAPGPAVPSPRPRRTAAHRSRRNGSRAPAWSHSSVGRPRR